jgi:hypothetical protein
MNGDYADEVWNSVVSFDSTAKIDGSVSKVIFLNS